ncbi:MAG: winged helix-turn-helix domain-containing protein [Flavobacteriales bacterium]|nr:winged helix-turn-helix domain-containing protein [Flavobacteriales bacterium]
MAEESNAGSLREAVRQVLEGRDIRSVATVHGVKRTALEHALSDFRKGGWDAVQGTAIEHRSRRKLTLDQEKAIHAIVRAHMPDQVDLPHPLWNREALLALIDRITGVRLPERTITTYMERWGFLPEKPVRAAFRKLPGVVREWMRRDFPVVAMQARALGGEVFWLGWRPLRPAPRGSTSKRPAATSGSLEWPDHTHLVFMTHNRGHVHWMVHDGPVAAVDIARFLERALAARGHSLMIIVPADPLLEGSVHLPVSTGNGLPQLQLIRLPVPR